MDVGPKHSGDRRGGSRAAVGRVCFRVAAVHEGPSSGRKLRDALLVVAAVVEVVEGVVVLLLVLQGRGGG